MTNDNSKTALAVLRNTEVRDRSTRTRARRLSGPRHNSASTKLAFAVLMGTVLFVFMPTPAQAGPVSAIVALGSKLFPTGTPVPGGASGVILALRGSSVTLKAPQYLYQPATPPATTPTVYEFMFWDVHTTLIATERAKFTVPSSGPVLATAWYLPVCVTSSCGGGASAVTTWAFSLTSYKVLPDTPIGLVTPASAWTSPSMSVSTATAVNITAQSYLGTETSTSGTVFSSWFVFGGASTVTISGLDLNVPAGESPYAIAFYYQYTHSPIICIGFPHCI